MTTKNESNKVYEATLSLTSVGNEDQFLADISWSVPLSTVAEWPDEEVPAAYKAMMGLVENVFLRGVAFNEDMSAELIEEPKADSVQLMITEKSETTH